MKLISVQHTRFNAAQKKIAKCLEAVGKSVTSCCITYDASAVGTTCNSNCVAYWMASTCFGGGVSLPSGSGMSAPGWGKEMPKCVLEAVQKAGIEAKATGKNIGN